MVSMEHDFPTLGALLKHHRGGRTVTEMSEATSIERSLLSRYEADTRDPPTDDLYRILVAYGIPEKLHRKGLQLAARARQVRRDRRVNRHAPAEDAA